MLKYILVSLLITYVLRRFIFTPIPGSQAFNNQKKEAKKDNNDGDYVDYEEIK